MNEWSTLFAATAGASATLTGLLFVGVSINLAKILATPSLPDRALISMLLLLTILVISVMALVPGQSYTALGIRILSIGMVVWVMMIVIDVRNSRQIEKKYKLHFIRNIMLDQIAVIAYIASGFTILKMHEPGLYWLISAFIFSFIKAVADAWVLLVEINR